MSDDGESSQTEEMIPNEIQQPSPSVAVVHPHRVSNFKTDISRLVFERTTFRFSIIGFFCHF